VYEQGGFAKQAVPLGVYIAQLALNFLWTPLFFTLHRFDLATVDILGARQPGRWGHLGGVACALRSVAGAPGTVAAALAQLRSAQLAGDKLLSRGRA
jgi:hypothetical protein